MADAEKLGGSLSRRSFLQAAAGSAAGLTPLTFAPANAGWNAGSPADYDVIVVGAGFAGLVAARDCALRGHRVLLLEGRDRVGGRTHDVDFRGSHIELGGTWIHWAQGYVWEEFSRYGLTIKESPYAISTEATWITNGKLHTGKITEVLDDLVKGLTEYCNVDSAQGASIFPRPHDNFFNRDLVESLDKLSLGDRLNAMKASQETKDLVASMIGIGCANSLDKGAFLDWAKWWALNDYSLQQFVNRQARYKIAEGTGALARAILADGPVDLKLSTTVTGIRQSAERATVTVADGVVYRARAVICTVPLTVLHAISFDPPLSPTKISTSKIGGCALGSKAYILIKEKIGLWSGMANMSYPITCTFTEYEREDGTLLIAFAPAGGIDFSDPSQAQRALRTLLPDVNVVSTRCHDWRADPFTRGTWSWYRPGQLTGAFDELRRPEGLIYFASGDSANGWRGFIDGAIESGVATARIVSQHLAGVSR